MSGFDLFSIFKNDFEKKVKELLDEDDDDSEHRNKQDMAKLILVVQDIMIKRNIDVIVELDWEQLLIMNDQLFITCIELTLKQLYSYFMNQSYNDKKVQKEN